jgi:uncharacterized protein YggE
MNRYFLPSLALAAALTLAPALADGAHTLAMGGHGEVKAAPDMVSVNAGVTTSAATAAAALSANTAHMKSVFAALEKLGVPERNIQTVNFSVSPQYTNAANNERPRLNGYQVGNEVSLRLEDISKLGAALDALVSAGANQMNGISFAIRDPAPLLEKARAAAIADARARAQTYARAAGVTLGPILSISEGGGDAPRPMYRMMAMAPPPPGIPVAAGEESVSADVSVVWEIH